MKLLNKLVDYLSFGLHGKCDEKIISKIYFLNLLSFTGFCFLAVFSAITLILGEYFNGLVTLTVALLLLGSIHQVKKTCRYSTIARFNLTLIIFALLLMFALGPAREGIIIWFPVIPALSVFILGIRKGTVVSLSFLIVAAAFFLLPEPFSNISQFNTLFTLRLSGLYLGILLIVVIFEHYRVNHLRSIELDLLEAQNETKLKESFISKLSHQIRTPLSNIMLVGHMVNKVNLTEEQRDMMETIIASANNLVTTIENVAEIAGVGIESKETFRNTGFNLHSTLNSTIRLFTIQKEPVVEFTLSVDETLINQKLKGDPVRLKQIFLNLIEAILKNKRPGKMNISIDAGLNSQADGIASIRFEIKTSKPVKLPLKDTESISLKNDITVHNYINQINTVDLNIADKIIRQMRGKLMILKTREKNLVFLFTLPFAIIGTPDGVVAADATGKSTPEHAEIKGKLKDINLLLVEDNTINQKIVELSLENYVKNIDVANNGKEALDRFGTSRYDVILMDVQMPVIDGFVATRKIREIEATTNSHTPVIAITANALHGDREKCLEAGMDDYISKPFQVEVLVDKIKQLLYLE